MNRRFAFNCCVFAYTGLFAAGCGKSGTRHAAKQTRLHRCGVGENRREESSRAQAIGGSRGYRVDGCFGSDDQFESHSFGGRFSATIEAPVEVEASGHPQSAPRRRES